MAKSNTPLEATWLFDYWNACKSGEILVGQEMMTNLNSLIDDYTSGEYVYNTDEADLRIKFIENCIKLTKSPFYGQPMKLMLWQKAFIEVLYSFKMQDGTDRFRRALLLIARKNTKSELSSALMFTEMILGNEGADIVCSSNDDNQASILFNAIDTMRLMVDPLEKDTHKNQQAISCNFNGSKIWKLSERTRNKEGRNIDFAVVDETHEMKDDSVIFPILQSQSLKPNPKLIEITTEGFTNEGHLDKELRYARSILNGEDTSIAAKRYLAWLYTQDSQQEVWQHPETWVKSNPTLSIVKRWDYLEEQVDKAKQSNEARAFVLSKDFNFKVADSEAWLRLESIDYDSEYENDILHDCIGVGGVDLAQTTDMCSAKCMIIRPDDKKRYIKSMYWIPHSKLENSDDKNAGANYSEWAKKGYIRIVDGNEVDVSLVADWYVELFKEYGIKTVMVGYDQRYSKDFLRAMDDYGIDCEMIYQNRYILSTPMRLVEADLNDEIIRFNNNPIDKWCLENTSVKVHGDGMIMPIKIKGQPSKRIDGTLSLIMCYEIMRRYKSEIGA